MNQPKTTPKFQPPVGWIPFIWKHKVVGEGVMKDSRQSCPVCHGFGFAYGGSLNRTRFMDKKVQNIWRRLQKAEKKGYLDKGDFDMFCIQVDGYMIKCHPSRFDFGECMTCHTRLCHDWGENYGTAYEHRDFYLPKGAVTLTAFARPKSPGIENKELMK